MDDFEQKAAKRVVKKVAATPEEFALEKIAKDLRQCAPDDLEWLRRQLQKRLSEAPPSFVRPYRSAEILNHLGDPACVHFHIQQLLRPVTSIEFARSLGALEDRRRAEQLAGPGISDEVRRSLLFSFEKRLTSHDHHWRGIPEQLLSLCEVWAVPDIPSMLVGLWNESASLEVLERLCRPEVLPLLTTAHVAAVVTAFGSSAKGFSECREFLRMCAVLCHSEFEDVRVAAASAADQLLPLDGIWRNEKHDVLPYRKVWSSELTGFLQRLLARDPSPVHAAHAVRLLAEFKPEAVVALGDSFRLDPQQRIDLCERIALRLNGSKDKKALRFIQEAAKLDPPERRLRFAFMCRMVGGAAASESTVASLSNSLSQSDRNLLDLAPDGNAVAPFDQLLRDAGLLKKTLRKPLPEWTDRPPYSARHWTLNRMEALGLAVPIWFECDQKVGRHDQAMLKLARLLKPQLGKATAKQSLQAHRNQMVLLSVSFECERGLCTLDFETSEKCLNVSPLYNAINWMLHREKLPERIVPVEEACYVAGVPERIHELGERFGWKITEPMKRIAEGHLKAIESKDWKAST
ncbi:hypothetical protein Pan44_35050 [Caulifigura coniformis]|uniref:Uncharacterized protein n=1 Tax=Caulifigura coniformis TaxID=2527983 RepID=A0A517SH75_9PLAN|nr:hypothetical protein [Caulifigura coniformis]QDT55462.1 hypothetical protein Pan44_35050 [Caulifigura coniformis]